MSTQARATIEVRSPADGRRVAEVPETSTADVVSTISRLRAAQPAWEALGTRGRGRWLDLLRDWLLDEADTIADVLQAETGKVRAEAGIEVPWICDVINHYVRHAASYTADTNVRASSPLTLARRQVVTRRPYPVVGVISPWNFPIAIPGLDAFPALAAGAAVVIKPSEVTPLSALELARGWREIGAPPVLEVCTGRAETGRAVVDHVDYVQFTGSTSTGRSIAHRAVERLIPYSLELGGKDAAIVLADADLDRAAHGVAWGGLFNSGQACVAIERVYVEDAVHDEFLSRLVDHVGALRQGSDAGRFGAEVGAMATSAQRDLVARHVQDAVDRGATVLTGGSRTGSGLYFEPTVLTGVDHSMTVMREETFGPLLPVMRVRDADEAISLANDSPYGLSATLWTRDLDRAADLARQLDVGAVNVNDVLINLMALGLPHGGWKQSGTGSRLGGAHGLRKYLREQALTVPRTPLATREPFWFPYTRTRGSLVRRLLRALVARDLRRRLLA